MKIVRIDDLGDTPQQFHPQLTVISGVDDALRERYIDIFNRIATGQGTVETVTLEVSGILLTADDDTMGQLQLDSDVVGAISMRPAFKQLRTVAPPPIPSAVFEAAAAVAPQPHTTSTTSPLSIREQLRDVAKSLQELQTRSDEHRDHIAPQAQAGVDVAMGQLDALERQHTAVREEWESKQQEFAQRQGAVTRELQQLNNQIRAIELWATARDEGFGHDISAINPNAPIKRVSDGEAAELADTLEQLLREVRQSSQRYVHYSNTAIEIRQQIRALEIELDTAPTEHASVSHLAAQRTKIEEIRSELFELVEHNVKSRTPWNRKRVEELRNEEAALLNELGYATYSDLIIGSSTLVHADESSVSRDELEQRLNRKRVELNETLEAMGTADELTRYVHQMTAVLRMVQDMYERAHRHDEVLDELQQQLTTHLGSPRLTGMSFDDALPNAVIGIDHIVAALREFERVDPAAEAKLQATLTAFAAHYQELQSSIGAELTHASSVEPYVAQPGPLDEQLSAAQSWLRSLDRERQQLSNLHEQVQQLESELAALESEHAASELLQRWSELEQQRDAILQRLLEAEEQLRQHQEALLALAEIRSQELELREQERDLITKLGAAEQPAVTSPQPHMLSSTDQHSTVQDTSDTAQREPQLLAQTASLVAVGRDVDAAERRQVLTEWDVVRELSFRRDVSFVGSVPVLVVDAELGEPSVHTPDRQALFHRLAVMSQHVQVVMLTNDESVIKWAYGLGTRAAVN